MTRSDKDLIPEILKGNQMAFKQVYYIYYNELCNFVRKYFNDKEDAEEIVQDTLVKIWEQREKLENVSSLRHYLFSSVKNHCLNEIEHLKVVRKHTEYAAIELKKIELEFENDFSEDNELERRIFDAIEDLPEQCGKIFKMKYLDGLRAKEIAEKTNLSQRTVETHIFNGLKHLRESLKSFLIIILVVYCFSRK